MLSVYVATLTVLTVSPATKTNSWADMLSKSPIPASSGVVLKYIVEALPLPSRVIVKVAVSPSETLISSTE